MLGRGTKRKITDIVSGKVLDGKEDSCTAARNYLCSGFSTSRTVKKDFEGQSIVKEEQARRLISYAQEHGIWLSGLPENFEYLTRGGESIVFIHSSSKKIMKINEAVYYATWLEYLNSILLHNLFFEDSAYSLVGFMNNNSKLAAVVQQPYVNATSQAAISNIREHLTYNGFVNKKRNDYYHPAFGLILEDMHDENVLISNGLLFFIDTVFYTAPDLVGY